MVAVKLVKLVKLVVRTEMQLKLEMVPDIWRQPGMMAVCSDRIAEAFTTIKAQASLGYLRQLVSDTGLNASIRHHDKLACRHHAEQHQTEVFFSHAIQLIVFLQPTGRVHPSTSCPLHEMGNSDDRAPLIKLL